LVWEQIAAGLTANRCVHIRRANFNTDRLPQGFIDMRVPLQTKLIDLRDAKRNLAAHLKDVRNARRQALAPMLAPTPVHAMTL
jgi:hypothetical protein